MARLLPVACAGPSVGTGQFRPTPWQGPHGGDGGHAGRMNEFPMNARSQPGVVVRILVLTLLAMGVTGLAPASGDTAAAVGGPGFSWFQFLAPFHMVVLHLPIGLFAAVILLEARAWRRPSPGGREVIGLMLGFGMLATCVTMGLGFLRATDGEYDAMTLGKHRGWGMAAAVLMGVSWGLHRHLSRHPGPGGLVAFRLLLATGFLSLAVAGHHGGTLTHGSALLTEHAPGVLRNLLQASVSTRPGPGSSPAAATSPGFGSLQPVLSHKCVGCHGPEKQKGGFRLDTRELAWKPGKSGRPPVVPGDPGRSELVRVLLLGPAHDEAMPPEGKERLTERELASVMDWIREGAR